MLIDKLQLAGDLVRAATMDLNRVKDQLNRKKTSGLANGHHAQWHRLRWTRALTSRQRIAFKRNS